MLDPSGKRLSIDARSKGADSTTWEKSLSNEWGRLADGNNYGVKGTQTVRFISKSEVPSDRQVTYATFVCDVKPLKRRHIGSESQ